MVRWLRTVRALYSLEQEDLGRIIGKSRSTVSMYEMPKGGREIPPDAIAAIRTALPDAPPAPTGELHPTGIVVALEGERRWLLPYAGVVPCSSDWGDPLDQSELRPIDPEFVREGRFLCRVGGQSCYPALREGDMTVWQTDADPNWGVLVLAQRTEDGACTVKQLAYSEERQRPVLVAVNPESAAPPDDGGWVVTARLIGVIRTGDGPKRTWGPYEAGIRPEHLAT